MHSITLNFEDGLTRIIDSLPHETVAETAYRHRLNIPLDCADGACGTCKCFCKTGDYDPGDYIEDALSDEEAEKGYGLACQMRPNTDLVIEILASSAACKVEVQSYSSIVKQVEFLSSEVVKLQVETLEKIDFLPGQYVNIEIPGTGYTRSYSFSNKPGQNLAEFIIRLIPDGVMSSFLRNGINAGQKLRIKGPLGSFYSRDLVRPTLFFAGGTGIAPFLSMLESMKEKGNTLPITLFYGATLAENVVEINRLKAFSEHFPLKMYTCVSGEETKAFAKGYVNQWINKSELAEEDYDIYICGPNAMVEAVKQSLHEHDIHHSNFYLEKFLPSGETMTS
ncbi:benzoate 1,2-dioxygenase electron transfer component BenC [Chryseobacterium sp. JM1]|uniref:benzoate 1,2-dioxygenase electron transfer component BenC n=1 Tax=Chryseobacterium sp. JM1 TaxID=1233950 RepID=UPI0006918461|nr:benzoate 1,2-dioxygenase electron transfer component BenC [Chryseobacterium sp. JM1]